MVVMKHRSCAVLILLFVMIAGCQSFGQVAKAAPVREIDLTRQQWNGDAICYSGYRGAENPDRNMFPSEQEILQDMTILSRHWHLLRIYGADAHGERVLKVVREKHLPIKVMLGIWLTGAPGHEAENETQMTAGIRLARQYPDVVAAVSVGNEALVSWSDHRMTEAQVIAAVERVKKAVSSPVTVADDYLYWINPDAALVKHVDFITLHTYPVWGNVDIDGGLSGTVANYKKVQQAHPGKTIVLGELGWPSYTVGERHVPRAGDERKQKLYFQQISEWAQANQVTAFIFEAFDESWKGTGTEGHWGLFSEGRKAKPAVLELYPELKPDQPTSPSYDDVPAQVAK
jgi:exo-beta-1,3-glucanase (GH17 family)